MKKPFYKTWWFIVIVVCILINAIVLLIDRETGQAVKATVESSTVEEQITEFINDELGKKTNNKKERVVSVGYVADTFEVVLNADDNLTVNLMKTAMLSDAAEVFEEIQKHEDIKGDVIVGFMSELVDSYSNKSDDKILSIRLTQEELDKINFENFLFTNFNTIADVYFEHPAIQ